MLHSTSPTTLISRFLKQNQYPNNNNNNNNNNNLYKNKETTDNCNN